MDGQYDCRDKLAGDLDIRIAPVTVTKGDTVGNYRRFRSYLRECGADRLLTYNWGTIEWGMANRPLVLPHVHCEDGFGPEEAHGQIRRRVLTRRIVLARSTVVVPSRTLERLALDVWKLNPARVRYVPNGIDVARFGAPGIDALSWPGEGPIIGTVAVLRREKNLGRLIGAFARLRAEMPCRLLIAGDGPERAKLEEQVAALDLSRDVMFCGYTAQTERIYAALDVFALSSDTEQMPTSVIEAMAAGLAVAATKVGDVANLVSSANQPFVVPPDRDTLADALRTLLKDAALREKIGAANQAVARAQFDETAMFTAYRGLFTGAY
jgi:glycosyltransferase involved in cell wall biosynthesis